MVLYRMVKPNYRGYSNNDSNLLSFQRFPLVDRIWFHVFFKYPLGPSFKWAELTLTSLSHQSNSVTNSNSPFLKHGNRDCVFFISSVIKIIKIKRHGPTARCSSFCAWWHHKPEGSRNKSLK